MTDFQSTPENRAKRLINLRKMLGFSRRRLGEVADVSPRNLENWEYARFNGLSEKGAQKIVTGLRALGCECTLEWLLQGVLPAPHLNLVLESDICSEATLVKEPFDHLQEELALLKRHQPNLIEFEVQDHSMEPVFYSGDHLAGAAVPLAHESLYLTKPSIIQLPDYSMLVRRVMKGSNPGFFNLVAHQTENVVEPYIYNAKPMMIAPVIWVRRFLDV